MICAKSPRFWVVSKPFLRGPLAGTSPQGISVFYSSDVVEFHSGALHVVHVTMNKRLKCQFDLMKYWSWSYKFTLLKEVRKQPGLDLGQTRRTFSRLCSLGRGTDVENSHGRLR